MILKYLKYLGVAQQVADNHNAFSAIVLKGHPSSKGTVRLTGSHPQDFLDIQKLHFQAPDGPADIAALREGIKRARQIVTSTPLALFVEREVSPGPNVTTDEEIDRYILEHVFGNFVPLDFLNDTLVILKLKGITYAARTPSVLTMAS